MLVVKSYRCYMSFDLDSIIAVGRNQPVSSTLLTAPLQRFHNEVRVHNLLYQAGADLVPLMGVYSTESHPLGLVYERMNQLDLVQYLRNEPNAGRLKLVLVSVATHALSIDAFTLLANSC